MPSAAPPLRTQYGSKAPAGLQIELPSFSFGSESIVAGTVIPAPEREPTPPPPSAKLNPTMSHTSENGASPDPLRSHPTTPGTSTPTGPPVYNVTSNGTSNGVGPTSTPRSVATSTTAASQSQVSNVQTSVSSGMSPPNKRPNNVRKLLSFRSLSNSFSAHGRSDSQMSGMTNVSGSDFGGPSRSQTPSLFGRTSSGTYARPGTSGGQSVAGSTATGTGNKPSLRKRVSGAFWSRRNSLMMSNMIDESDETMEVGHSPGSTGATPPPKRQKPSTPAPQLPEIGNLKVSKGLKDSDDGFLNSKDLFSGVRYKREVSAEEMAAMKKQRRGPF